MLAEQSGIAGDLDAHLTALSNDTDLVAAKRAFMPDWAVAYLTQPDDAPQLCRRFSQFAERTIDIALNQAWQAEAPRFGIKSPSASPEGLFILGLGKLGGEDLNVSSDVDLIGFYDPETFPVSETRGQAYAAGKVLQRMSKILMPNYAPDFVWRVDWRLRPESSGTGLAMSTPKAEQFYFFRALPWHRLALMKARIVAGDSVAGARFLQNITPFIWRQNLDFSAIDELAELKSRINQEHPGLQFERTLPSPITPDPGGCNIKLGRGGIREIEFIANAQQLIWGGKQSELRVSHTLSALSRLSVLGHLPNETTQALSAIYLRHRRLENALQLLNNEQTHSLPDGLSQIGELLAQDPDVLAGQLYEDRQYVGAQFDAMFRRTDNAPTRPELSLVGLNAPAQTIAKSWLTGFADHGVSAAHKSRYQSLARALVTRLQNSTANADESFQRVDRFLRDLSRSEQYFGILAQDEKLLDALITPLLHSPHMTELLRQSPHIIDSFIDPQSYANSPKAEPDIRDVLILSDYETRLERLRRFVNEHLFQYYTAFLNGQDNTEKLQANLTRLADGTLKGAVRIAEDALGETDVPMVVLGLGKMGTSRMAPQSDIDLIFIFDDAVDPNLSRRMVSRLQTILTMRLREGIAYDLDMRLRPSGRSGPPAVALSQFRKHHLTRAKTWEHIALAPARIVTGSADVAAKVRATIEDVLTRPRNSAQLRGDAAVMWSRIADQRVTDTPPNHFNAKLRPGGLMQAEYFQACCALAQSQLPDGVDTAIAHFSTLQIWERLLGLRGQPYAQVPRYVADSFHHALGPDPALETARLSQIILGHFDDFIQGAPIPETEAPIGWISHT